MSQDKPYDLVDPATGRVVGQHSARAVFDAIVTSAWQTGEPGIIFLDRLNRDNVVPSQGEIESTNPCGEQPLLPYESCNLGSINLVNHLMKTPAGWVLDRAKLEKTIRTAVHFLDNVIEVNQYPLPEIDRMTRSTRKIGLGVMGFADMLLHMGVPYNSEEGVALAEEIMDTVNSIGHQASEELAEIRGPFPLFDQSIYKMCIRDRVSSSAPPKCRPNSSGCTSPQPRSQRTTAPSGRSHHRGRETRVTLASSPARRAAAWRRPQAPSGVSSAQMRTSSPVAARALSSSAAARTSLQSASASAPSSGKSVWNCRNSARRGPSSARGAAMSPRDRASPRQSTSELLFPRGTAYLSSRSCSARTFRSRALTARREGFSPSSDVQNTIPTLWRPLPPQC